MRKINKIILHCSASAFGNILLIDEWHKARGWDGCGYHYVLLNGRPHRSDEYFCWLDGGIETGRSLNEKGAHVKGQNEDSLGICFIGPNLEGEITPRQNISARAFIRTLLHRLGLHASDVGGHCEFDDKKPSCPGINMDEFRSELRGAEVRG